MAEPAPRSSDAVDVGSRHGPESIAAQRKGRYPEVTAGGRPERPGDAQDTPVPWLLPTVRELRALLALPDGWNSYRAARIDPGAILTALELLAQTMTPTTPAPSVVPMSRGGVQLEWHEQGVDLEVSVDPDGHVMAAYENEQGTEWEDDLTERHARLAEALAELASRR
jgi:hypothetical protein